MRMSTIVFAPSIPETSVGGTVLARGRCNEINVLWPLRRTNNAQRRLLPMNRNTATFLVLCVIWGTTWIGIKAGIATVPPLMFAGTRFTVAGLLILSATRLRG